MKNDTKKNAKLTDAVENSAADPSHKAAGFNDDGTARLDSDPDATPVDRRRPSLEASQRPGVEPHPAGTEGEHVVDDEARRLEMSELERLGEPSAPEGGDGTHSRESTRRHEQSGFSADEVKQLITDALANEGVEEPGDKADDIVEKAINERKTRGVGMSIVSNADGDAAVAGPVPSNPEGVAFPAGRAPKDGGINPVTTPKSSRE